MSEKTPQLQPSEEVDLGQLFKLIGNTFNKLVRFIKSIFIAIFSIFIYALKPIIKYYKQILILMFLAAVLGYAMEKIKKDIYLSQMLVKPYFDSKFQLITNVGYYNALIADKDYNQLANLFSIKQEDAKSLVEFEIKPGPESENDRILQYENFIKSIDSIRAQNISFKDYIENRSVYSGNIFEINVKSHKKDIFKSLEKGMNSNFSNGYSVKQMKKRDSLIIIDKERILKSLDKIDSLQKVYITVMQEESKGNKNNSTITLKDGMSLVQERIDTKEYELLDKELELRTTLTRLESQLVEDDTYFDTISDFQEVGSKYSSIWDRYTLIFPILTFILISLIYLLLKFVKFISKYQDINLI